MNYVLMLLGFIFFIHTYVPFYTASTVGFGTVNVVFLA